MSGLRVRQAHQKIRELFESHLDLSDLSATDNERDVKVLTRCLSALAIYKATGCSEAEAGGAVWDGSDDNGIDAAFYDENEKQVVIVQSKWIQAVSGEPPANEISVFANGVKDLIEDQIDNFAIRLHTRLAAISKALSFPGTTVHLVLISTGSSTIAPHGTRNLKRILDELNGHESVEDGGVATFEVMGLAEVYSVLSDSGSVGKIKIEATILDWSYVSQPFPAYFGIIDGYQLKIWWDSYGKRLLIKNIRQALGQTDVNIQIRHTAINSPENFWYFNNGITLIADDATRAPAAASSRSSGIFELQGASIVNGAQTVSTLAKVDDEESLGRVRVPIRVILLKSAPASFGVNVTRTNNLQNRVEGRDFVSEDAEQSRIRSEMAIEGITYQYQRSDEFEPSETSCELNEVTTALACASPDVSHAVAAKTGIGRFYNDLSKAPYKSLFNPKTSGAKAFNSVRVLRAVDAWIDVRKNNLSKRSGYAWGVLVHGNRSLAASVFQQYGISKLETPIGDFDKLYVNRVNELCQKVYENMVSFLDDKYPNKFLAVLFKSPGKSKEVYANIESNKF